MSVQIDWPAVDEPARGPAEKKPEKPAAKPEEKQPEKAKKKQGWTYTKKAVTILLIVGVAGGIMPYILSALDKDPAESMGIAWVTEIVAVILGYLCKSYFETKQEAKQATEERKINAYMIDDKFDPSKAAG